MKLNLQILKMNKPKKIMNALFALLCVGLILILFNNKEVPKKTTSLTKGIETVESTGAAQELFTYSDIIKAQLEEELAKIEGVGRVVVVLTMKTKGEIVLNKDSPYATASIAEQDHEGGNRESKESEQEQTTVILKKENGSEEAIVVKEYLPEVSGILIIAEGGDDLIVKNNLINVAKVLLDLQAHKIEVMKMVTQ